MRALRVGGWAAAIVAASVVAGCNRSEPAPAAPAAKIVPTDSGEMSPEEAGGMRPEDSTLAEAQWPATPHGGTLVTLGHLSAPATLLTLFGLVVVGILLARGVPGALLIGMLASTVVGLATGLVSYQGLVGVPPSVAPTLLKLDLFGALSPTMLPVILIFFFLALFDSVGTLVGVGQQAGLGQGLEAQLLAGVRGVGHQLAQEDVLVRIQRMDDQLQDLLDIGLEGMGLGLRGDFGAHLQLLENKVKIVGG